MIAMPAKQAPESCCSRTQGLLGCHHDSEPGTVISGVCISTPCMPTGTTRDCTPGGLPARLWGHPGPGGARRGRLPPDQGRVRGGRGRHAQPAAAPPARPALPAGGAPSPDPAAATHPSHDLVPAAPPACALPFLPEARPVPNPAAAPLRTLEGIVAFGQGVFLGARAACSQLCTWPSHERGASPLLSCTASCNLPQLGLAPASWRRRALACNLTPCQGLKLRP